MRAYRSAWRTVVAVVTIAALLAGGADTGWPILIAAVAVVAVGGATIGYAGVEDRPRRRRAMSQLALWFGIGAVMVLGLPLLIGSWGLLAIVLLAVLCPPSIAWLLDRRHLVGPPPPLEHDVGTMSVSDLQLRWSRTGQELRVRRADPHAALALVKERALLLDEIERRDPVAFRALLERAGWQARHDWRAGPP